MPTINKNNKICLTPSEKRFIKANYQTKTNQQLADYLGLKLTTTRSLLYSLGLKRMELEYWTDEQVNFLKENYQRIGDVEIAEIFTTKYPKDKGWSKKHIEKKRRYLKLKRTPEERENIRKRNQSRGVWSIGNKKMWETRGITPIGALKVWKNYNGRIAVVIRTEKGFESYSRYLWQQHYGEIPKGYNVCLIDGNVYNTELSNLELLSDADLQMKNAKARANTPEVIKRIKKNLRKLTEIQNTK